MGQPPWGLVTESVPSGSVGQIIHQLLVPTGPGLSPVNKTAAPLPAVIIPPQASPLLLNKTEGATGGFLEDGLHVNPVSPD